MVKRPRFAWLVCGPGHSKPSWGGGRARSRIGVGFQGCDGGCEARRLPCPRRDDLERLSACVWEKEQLRADIGEVRPRDPAFGRIALRHRQRLTAILVREPAGTDDAVRKPR